MKTDYIDYQDGDTTLEGYLAWDDSATEPRPLVLVAHDWSGRREYACSMAERVAELGYCGFALDLYGKGVFGSDGDKEGNSALMMPYVEDRALLRRRMKAALEVARSLPQADSMQVAAMGFCFGGMAALELARSGADIQGAISVHGLLGASDLPTERIKAKVLCLHGHDDPLVEPALVLSFENEMTAAGADWQVHVFGGTRHAFTNPAAHDHDFGTVYDERANARSLRLIADFLEEVFA